MSVTQATPTREALLVEFPGYVRSQSAVVSTLGGLDAVTKAASGDNSVLQLRFRPEDPYTHPLYGERQAAKGLLLKIARKSADSSQEGVKAEVLACVHTKFTFSGMADYQYLPQDLSKSGTASSSSAGPYGEETLPLLCVPPLYTKADVPLDYAFKNFRASDRPASGKAKQPPWMIPYTAQDVPAQVQPNTDQGGAAANPEPMLETHLNARPIWTQLALAHQLPHIAQADLQLQLQKQCYQFKEGPWKGAWIRRGHDPRTDKDSLHYQTIQYDLPPDWYERTAANQSNAAAAHNGSHMQPDASNFTDSAAGPSLDAIHRFEALPMSQSSVFQLCDLVHPELQELLQQSEPAAECDNKTGWLSKADWDQIVDKVAQLFSRHMS